VRYFKEIGRRFDKPVYLLTLDQNINEISPYAKGSTVALIVNNVSDKTQHYNLINLMISWLPLSISTFEYGDRVLFDRLIKALNDGVDRDQIMTYLLNQFSLQEALDEYFSSSFPSFDRIDLWNCYIIICDVSTVDAVANECRFFMDA
jgi:hypothetical protein